ncbi:hypothetical protein METBISCDRAFT_27583 [Metschnikowia bicuspidata]|uniref:Uncharacterized protein n=1 Tax=Metschnikowia bicuspidata TaxID=27322 RepID=A0A4P9ZBQ4_9ASCO|nr:hypothetical protein METBISCDRAFT_27583 [Metschnikowia bicuspidata]
MSLLQNALARVARKVQQDQLRRQKPVVYVNNETPAQAPPRTALRRVSKEKLRLAKEDMRHIQKKRFQDFFAPLKMPLLRIYDDEIAPYDFARAEANLAAKLRKDRAGLLNTYLNERSIFTKMLDFLVESTPEHLKSSDTVSDPELLASVLQKENAMYTANQYPDVPRYSFAEVPLIPYPLDSESFREYIYTLTHTQFPYRNSSSLASGIIPEILLHTHHLENEEYKPYRSVDTYNYLISFFGYNKFQNFFARGLLLVMAKDGHSPNIHTINELLKICRIHNKKRSLVSTYQVVINYLDLAKKMDLQINLTTWNRIYDCMNNIFFKEAFINKMLVINLPLLDNMCIRILSDYCLTTKSTKEVITFVEKDLRRPDWTKDPRLAGRVLSHLIRTARDDVELQHVFSGLVKEIALDALSLAQMATALLQNRRIFSPSFHLLCIYLAQNLPMLPEVYIALIKGLCLERNSLKIASLAFVVRGVLHDASIHLKLPRENDTADPKSPEKRLEHFPYPIPRANISERYRMLKRLTLTSLTELEAAVIYTNHHSDLSVAMPWQPLSEQEAAAWNKVKETLQAEKTVHTDASDVAASLGLVPPSPPIPDDIISRYQRVNNISIGTFSDLRALHRVERGTHAEFEKELRLRGILRTGT